MPVVSVILAFDQIAWLRDAVQSVLDQTFRDFELILVDDTSDEPLTDLPLTDRRIRYIGQDQTAGLPSARNLGLHLAKGRYIAFLDADAIFLPHKLERQVSYMVERRDVALTHTSYQRMTAAGEVIDEIRSGAHSALTGAECLLHNPIATPTVMIRRDVGDGALRFDESIQSGAAQILWAELGKRHHWIGIDECLVRVRVLRDALDADPEQQVRGAINVMNAPVARNSPAIAALRRSALSRIYLESGTELWRELGVADIWRLDPAGLEVTASTATGLAAGAGEEAVGAARLAAALAERDAVIRDLHWTLERQAERFAAERSAWPGGDSPADRATARPRDELVERDEALAALHDEVIERDETIAWLRGEVAALQGAVAKRDRVLVPLGVLALARLVRRLRTARLRTNRHAGTEYRRSP